ncbi:MAG: hypothetical protein WCY32_04085 [Burkholderiaceae bacterium]
MMVILRLVALLGLGSVGFCAVAWLLTRQRLWLDRALLALKITVALAVLFFIGMFIERFNA